MLDTRDVKRGSFEAWGKGFHYSYNNDRKTINILHKDTERLLSKIKLDDHLSTEPLAYAEILEKASQISALMVSNNQSVVLSSITNLQQLRPLLNNVARLSRHAFDLKYNHLSRFCRAFATEYDIQRLKIKRFSSDGIEDAFFIARLQTKTGNGISVRACTMTGIMAAMSDKTLKDLITMEFGHRRDQSLQKLINVSSKFASLSYILDTHFIPENKIFTSLNSYVNEEEELN